MKNFIKFLITCLTVIFVSCSLTPEVEVSPAQEYKITYTVSGTGEDAVTVNGPATAKSSDTVTFTIDGIGFDKRLVSVEYYSIPTAITTKKPANTVSPCRDWIPTSRLSLNN